MKSIIRSYLAVRSKMIFLTESYCLLLSEFPGFSTASCDVPLMPLYFIYTIDKFFITTVMEPEIKKYISLILRGLFQHFFSTTIKSVFNFEVIHASTEINIGSIIIEKPASCNTSIYLMGIVSTSSKTIRCYNITFNDGSVSFVDLSTNVVYFHYVVPNIMFYIIFRLDGNSLEKRYCANSCDFLYLSIILLNYCYLSEYFMSKVH